MEVNIKEEKEMSQFCETLMRVAGAVGHLKKLNDCAIVLASDGTTLSARQCGLYPDVLNMVYAKMVNDDKFAELIVEAGMLYSRYLQGKTRANSDQQDGNEQES